MTEVTYSDAYLDHFADQWLALGLKRHGISLTAFLADPQRYLNAPLPLLPRQQAVAEHLAEQAERGVENLPRRNGRIVEPLHHHAHPRNHNSGFFPKTGGEQ